MSATAITGPISWEHKWTLVWNTNLCHFIIHISFQEEVCFIF